MSKETRGASDQYRAWQEQEVVYQLQDIGFEVIDGLQLWHELSRDEFIGLARKWYRRNNVYIGDDIRVLLPRLVRSEARDVALLRANQPYDAYEKRVSQIFGPPIYGEVVFEARYVAPADAYIYRLMLGCWQAQVNRLAQSDGKKPANWLWDLEGMLVRAPPWR